VLALVPAADPVVGPHREHLDRAAAWGVPAHLTVIYPFVPPDEVDDQLLARLGGAVAAVPAFDVVFRRTAWFGQDVLWLAPDPAQPFRDLTAAVLAAFPDHPPYGGAFDGSAPHLTVGERRFGDLAALLHAETAVGAQLPLTARVDRIQLLAGSEAPGSWAVIRELPLPEPPGPWG
jgi:2'-5' RNA ligase